MASTPEPAASAQEDEPGGPFVEGRVLLETQFRSPDGEMTRVVLTDRGQLHVGSSTSMAVDHAAPDPYFWARQASLEVVPFTADQRVVIFSSPDGEVEDPPNRYQLFLIEEHTLVRIFDETVGTYGVHPIELPGNGTLSFVEDDWTACTREKGGTSAESHRVVFELDSSRRELVEAERIETGQMHDCNNLAACPFVYVIDGDDERFVGEILRNVRGQDAYTTQGLPLTELAPREGMARIELREEKPEVTYLDAVYLEVDGQTVLPTQCAIAPLPYCSVDGVFTILEQGESLPLTFAVGAPPAQARLVATGYYVPILH